VHFASHAFFVARSERSVVIGLPYQFVDEKLNTKNNGFLTFARVLLRFFEKNGEFFE
jgi:hypothetical protein